MVIVLVGLYILVALCSLVPLAIYSVKKNKITSSSTASQKETVMLVTVFASVLWPITFFVLPVQFMIHRIVAWNDEQNSRWILNTNSRYPWSEIKVDKRSLVMFDLYRCKFCHAILANKGVEPCAEEKCRTLISLDDTIKEAMTLGRVYKQQYQQNTSTLNKQLPKSIHTYSHANFTTDDYLNTL